MKLPNARDMRLALAKKMRRIVEDLEYKPAPDECVPVEPSLFRELLENAELIAEYQDRMEVMPTLTDTHVRDDNEKALKKLKKRIEDTI